MLRSQESGQSVPGVPHKESLTIRGGKKKLLRGASNGSYGPPPPERGKRRHGHVTPPLGRASGGGLP